MSKEEVRNLVSLQEEQDKRTIFRIQKTKEDPYVRIIKSALQDERLSWKARGILGYMLTLPDDWVFYREELLKHAPDGRKSLLSGLKELKEHGYLKIVPEKNNKGQVIRWITHVFEIPQTVPEKTQNPKKGNLGKNQNPLFENVEKGECRKGTTTNNRSKQTIDLKNNKQSPALTKPTPEVQQPCQELDQNVVVSLLEQVQEWAISEVLVRTWLKRHSAEYILCKIEYTKSYATKNPAGLLRRAIENDYKLPLSKQAKTESKAPAEPVYPTHEENIAWYEKLSDNEKMAYLKAAIHRHPMFENHLKHQKLSVLDQGFVKNGLFKDLMQLVGRAE